EVDATQTICERATIISDVSECIGCPVVVGRSWWFRSVRAKHIIRAEWRVDKVIGQRRNSDFSGKKSRSDSGLVWCGQTYRWLLRIFGERAGWNEWRVIAPRIRTLFGNLFG